MRWVVVGAGAGATATALVLTALPEEREAVRALLADVTEEVHPAGTRYDVAALPTTDALPAGGWRVVLGEVGRNNPSAAALTERAIGWYRPAAVLFVGIAGGLWPEISLGDVVVAECIYAVHGARDEPDGPKLRPKAWQADYPLLELAKKVAADRSWLAGLTPKPGAESAVRFRPIAAGEVVLNSVTSELARRLRDSYNDAVAVDNEDAGFAQAAHLSRTPALVVRGISDNPGRADKAVTDRDERDWRRVAAGHAAAFAMAVAARFAADPVLTQAVLPARPSTTGRLAAPPVSSAGGWWKIPSPPDGLVERPELAETLIARLVAPGPATVAVSTALYGAGGFGKTSLAQVACADPRVRRRFTVGIWVNIGESARAGELASKINDVYYQIAGERPALHDPEQAGLNLGALLDQHRDLLLVLDDVWQDDQLGPFLHGGAGGCTRLITTRHPDLLPLPVRRVAIEVDQLTNVQTFGLLTGDLPQLAPLDLSELVRLTGRWPLLVQLAHRYLATKLSRNADPADALAALVARLYSNGPATLDPRSAGSRERAAGVSINASLDLLTPDQRDRFIEMGIFAEDGDIPRDMLALLWGRTGDLTRPDVDDLADQLASLSLTIERTGDRVRLHDVIRAYLRHHGKAQLAATNAAFLDAATALLPRPDKAADTLAAVSLTDGTPVRPWWELPDGASYLWDHLAYHVAEAGGPGEFDRCIADLRWVAARLRRAGPVAAAVDLATAAPGQPATDRAAELSRALARATHLLTPTDPEHCLIDVWLSRVRDQPRFHDEADRWQAARTQPRLVGRWPLPDLPDQALRRILFGHMQRVWSVAISPDETWLATASDDRTVRLWVATPRSHAMSGLRTGDRSVPMT